MKDLEIHYSLLPAFNQSDDPIRDAILAGVKVSGITITLKNRIVAQYPIFITNDMHYDELKLYLKHIAEIMFPLVKEKLENNEAFEIQTLMKSSKCGGCKGCNQCTEESPASYNKTE